MDEDRKVKRKTEAQAIFLNRFTVCSASKQKLVVCKKQVEVIRFQTDKTD
jgi:hypothetical protein